MSRAFVKEDGPEDTRLPDLPLSPHPNHVTPTGLAQLQARLAAAQATLAILRARPDRLDRQPEAVAARDIRYLEARLRSAILVQPPAVPQAAAFGVAVTCADDKGQIRTWRIVGEDEADAGAGLISAHSPVARALIGAEVGDQVDWEIGARIVSMTVLTLSGQGVDQGVEQGADEGRAARSAT